LQQYKVICKFKDGPIQNEEEKVVMFKDIRNTRDDHWTLSSGNAPLFLEGEYENECPQFLEGEYGNECHNENDKKDEDYEGNEGSDECEEITPTSSAKGKRPAPPSRKDKGKQLKTAEGHWVQDQLSKLVTMTERSTASCESLARREDISSCSIKDVMTLVKECGVIPGTVEHFIAF
jgi:hypothetical protein